MLQSLVLVVRVVKKSGSRIYIATQPHPHPENVQEQLQGKLIKQS